MCIDQHVQTRLEGNNLQHACQKYNVSHPEKAQKYNTVIETHARNKIQPSINSVTEQVHYYNSLANAICLYLDISEIILCWKVFTAN
jgi:hypothetical protein